MGADDARRPVIVWAMEAFPNRPVYDSELKMVSALHWHFPNSTIIPVYILSDRVFAARGFGHFLRPALKPAALKVMRRFFSDISRTHSLRISRPRVLREASSSRDDCALKLVRFAEKIHADYIALGSRGIPLLARLMGQSFSEAVLRFSRIPLFVVGPNVSTCSGPPQAVILACDFTAPPTLRFNEILKFVANFEAELHLFHKTDSRSSRFFKFAGVSPFTETLWSAQHSFHSEHAHELRLLARLRDWIDLTRARGIKTRLANENFRETTAKAIVNYLRRLGDASALVALTAPSKQGPYFSNIAREVIRMSPFPVFMTPA